MATDHPQPVDTARLNCALITNMHHRGPLAHGVHIVHIHSMQECVGYRRYLLPKKSDKKPPRGRAQKFIRPKVAAKLAALTVEKLNCLPR